MYARVWKFGILPGKTEEFDAVAKSIVSAWKRMAGFRGLLVMRTGPGEMLDATVISTWETMEELRGSENKTFQETVVRVLSYCEPRPSMREEQVVVNEYPSQGVSDITAID
jgi:heme-degrading monooxygenase HmoA